jgi:hypothetical protein
MRTITLREEFRNSHLRPFEPLLARPEWVCPPDQCRAVFDYLAVLLLDKLPVYGVGKGFCPTSCAPIAADF